MSKILFISPFDKENSEVSNLPQTTHSMCSWTELGLNPGHTGSKSVYSATTLLLFSMSSIS